MKKSIPPLSYGTRQVAEILGIPEWRVKNFTEGAAYRLPPGVQAGKGRGTRRLYDWGDIFRIGLADKLVKFGFTPETVGQAVREIPESLLTPYAAMLYERSESKLSRTETPILVGSGVQWQIKMASEMQQRWTETIEHEGSIRGLFIINLANLFDAIFEDLHCTAKICANPDCPHPYFLQKRKGQIYCSHPCAVLINVRRFRERESGSMVANDA